MKGPKGTLSMPMADEVIYDVQADSIGVKPANETKRARAFWGMQRTLVQNLVTGVTDGFTKKLLITGVGYRADSKGKVLNLKLGTEVVEQHFSPATIPYVCADLP